MTADLIYLDLYGTIIIRRIEFEYVDRIAIEASVAFVVYLFLRIR